jgi:hypothetical protein
VLPTATLRPEGVELTVSPLRPLAVSVSVAVVVVVDEFDGVTSSVADCVTPPPDTEIVTNVSAETDDVKMLKPPRVVPAGCAPQKYRIGADRRFLQRQHSRAGAPHGSIANRAPDGVCAACRSVALRMTSC